MSFPDGGTGEQEPRQRIKGKGEGKTGSGRPIRAAFVEVARSLFRRAVSALPIYAEEPQWDAFTWLRIWDHNEFPDTGPEHRHGLSPHP